MKLTANGFALALALCLIGCAPVGGTPSGGSSAPAGVSEVRLAAENAPRDKAAAMAEVARETAAAIRLGKFKEFADIEAFESPKNQLQKSPEFIQKLYEPLRLAQDARLGREKDGKTLDFVRDASGNPDWEATAKIWDETAEGFERVAKERK